MERRITLRRMLSGVIEDQLSINATLPRTLRALLFHPGLLSSEYLDGRIQRYVPPFRLYLAASVVFFLLLSFLASGGSNFIVHVNTPVADSTRTLRELIEREDTIQTPAERERALKPFRTGWTRLDSMGNQGLGQLLDLPPQQAARTLTKGMLQRAPTAAFLMLPCFALLLQLLYFRRRRYYVEHFVFALHTHAFLFVLFTVMLLGARLPWIGPPLLLWLVIYNYLALRKYYGGGRVVTLVRYGVLGLLYMVVFGAGMTFTVLATLLLS